MDFESIRPGIAETIGANNTGPSSLLQVLNAVQEEHGHLPKEAQEMVAKELKLPLSKVYEVMSFYNRLPCR